jgi:predicted flap endonuclease-1-like 5' DNA nuclease
MDRIAIPIPFDKLAAPARRAVNGAGYFTLQQLAMVTESEITCLHGIGPRAASMLKQELVARALSSATA